MMPAEWSANGESNMLRVRAGSLREALSPGMVALAAALGVSTTAVALAAGGSLSTGALVGLLLGALCLVFTGYLRLSSQATDVTIALNEQTITFGSDQDRVAQPLTSVSRLRIVHDGAPARIAIHAGGMRRSWAIGHLYRHNTIERFVEEIPEQADRWLTGSGMRRTSTMRRGVLTTEYRR
ncbi:hypothetical protein ACIFOC_00499 [Leucobacter aridicollis]|uniref:hypothetical protein n=1 Tax=Leucobacter aridicollis TaxID=283878 RepID=UPI0037C60106